MKLQQRAVAASVRMGTTATAAGSVPNLTRTAFNNDRLISPASEQRFAPASSAWTHTLIITGELDRSSAHALEVAIEHLCEEGVTGITLDLRKLTYIDSIGVAVIAFRCGLCQRRGYDFALVPGPRCVQRVFEEAGVAEMLPFQEDVAIPRERAVMLSHGA